MELCTTTDARERPQVSGVIQRRHRGRGFSFGEKFSGETGTPAG